LTIVALVDDLMDRSRLSAALPATTFLRAPEAVNASVVIIDLAAYAAVNYASKTVTGSAGQSFTAGKLGKFTVGADHTILLGPPFVFTKANISQFNF